MRVVETDWWTLDLPEEWEAEQDDDAIVIIDADGVSCIELVTLLRESGAASETELRELAADLIDAGVRPVATEVAGWRGLLFVHDDEEDHWREWFLGRDGQVLLIAYHCLLEHAGMDDAAVDEILDTLTPV